MHWNSCPFEWAKYSCVHQGNAGHAARARMRFEPAGCAMLSVDGRQLARAVRPNQRLVNWQHTASAVASFVS